MDLDEPGQIQGVKANGKTAAIINELLSRQTERTTGTPEADLIFAEKDEIADKLISEVGVIKVEPAVASTSPLAPGAVAKVSSTARNGEIASVSLRHKCVIDLHYNRPSFNLK
jgi:hypothetical protein